VLWRRVDRELPVRRVAGGGGDGRRRPRAGWLWPVVAESQQRFPAPARDLGGGMQVAVAQLFGFGSCEVAVEGDHPSLASPLLIEDASTLRAMPA
jgi:hypothetical protein